MNKLFASLKLALSTFIGWQAVIRLWDLRLVRLGDEFYAYVDFQPALLLIMRSAELYAIALLVAFTVIDYKYRR